ncbi:MAG: Crp/Fnr family transcriptional regulator [Xenococcaceae cyanobacterium MO_207.B15]|nr:Crp/Fnr family transcriptional regulator [Xenococcaceae cyanobacterium MO_207.B15]
MLLRDQTLWNIHQKNRDELLLQSYEKGEAIPICKGCVWQVYRGVIQLSKLNINGEEIVLGWITPNHVFGNLFEQNLALSSLALTDVYVRQIRIQEIQKSPYLARELLSEFSYRSIKSQQLLAINALRRVEARLWQLILMLAEEMGHSTDNGIRLTARFTHHNLAKVICTTRVTITRLLGDFQNRGWIEFDKERHMIVKTLAPIIH